MRVQPKDYVATSDNLFFAVLSDQLESGRVLSYLRYQKTPTLIQKLTTHAAAELIQCDYPDLLFYSTYGDITLHGIPIELITQHYCPRDTLSRLLALKTPDLKQQDAVNMINLLLNSGVQAEKFGITGSIMLDFHDKHSDIDLVVYGRDQFFHITSLIQQKIATGTLTRLERQDLATAYYRRGGELSLAEYCQYQQRKYNHCLSGSSKVDISLIAKDSEKFKENGPYKKLRADKISGVVIDDTYAYDFPSRYFIDHKKVNEIVSYTSTYAGQARVGEMIAAAGYIEQDVAGKLRLLVGSSREAIGEYIRIVK